MAIVTKGQPPIELVYDVQRLEDARADLLRRVQFVGIDLAEGPGDTVHVDVEVLPDAIIWDGIRDSWYVPTLENLRRYIWRSRFGEEGW